jgi:hypothetical protein
MPARRRGRLGEGLLLDREKGLAGHPVERKTKPVFVVWATASTMRPPWRRVSRTGGDGRSRSQMSWWIVWRYQRSFPVPRRGPGGSRQRGPAEPVAAPEIGRCRAGGHVEDPPLPGRWPSPPSSSRSRRRCSCRRPWTRSRTRAVVRIRYRPKHPGDGARPHIEGLDPPGRRVLVLAHPRRHDDEVPEEGPRRRRVDELLLRLRPEARP